MIGKVTTGFQITIPLHFRKKYRIRIGDYIEFHEQNGRLIISPLKPDNKASKAIISNKNSEDHSIKLIKKEIKILRERLENIEDYREAKKAYNEFKESGEKAIPYEKVLEKYQNISPNKKTISAIKELENKKEKKLKIRKN